MLKAVLRACVFAGCLGSISVAATAQQVVHALTGTVRSIDDLSKTIILFQDNGAEGQFKDMTSGKVRVQLDKKVTLETTPAAGFKNKGAYVIVFYYGDNDDRTAVALKDLGAGPFTAEVGTVVKFDSKGHSIEVKDESGKSQTFKLTDQTVAEGYMGVTIGSKFQAEKGDRIRIVASTESGEPTALFLRQM